MIEEHKFVQLTFTGVKGFSHNDLLFRGDAIINFQMRDRKAVPNVVLKFFEKVENLARGSP